MPDSSARISPYQFFMLALCILVLISLAYETFGSPDPEIRRVLFMADTAVCAVFLGDFLYSLRRAEDKARYFLTWGWIDLISSVPAIGFVRWGRAARVTRILRLFRGARSVRTLGRFILEKRGQSTALAVLLFTLLAIVFSSIAVLTVEREMGGAITTAQDALWWAVVTVTTVGYGDLTPVTPLGRLCAIGLMLVGIALFTTVTAYIATWFLEPEEQERDRDLAEIKQELAAIRALMEKGA